MRNRQGNAIAQYGIIIALVALALIPVLYSLGGTIVQQFTNFSQGFGNSEVANNGGGGSSNDNPGGTKDPKDLGKPILDPNDDDNSNSGNVDISCKKDSCTIDFGGYQLTGIPENFGEYIESSGSSGGTDKVVALLEQIAASPELSPDQKNLVEQLANKGHSLANIEKIIEQQAQILSDEGTEPDSNFEQDGEVLDMRLTEFGNLLTSVLSSLNNDPEAKALVNTLSAQIVSLATDMNLAHQVAINSCTEEGACSSNVMQGATVETEPYTNSLDDILNPEASSVSDLDSALICATGHGDDTGIECN